MPSLPFKYYAGLFHDKILSFLVNFCVNGILKREIVKIGIEK